MGRVRKRIIVSGRVQGVGFRYRASYAAQLLGLTGWVRNDPEGTVTMELQGEEEAIYRLIPIVEQGSWVSIKDWQEQTLPIDEEELAFCVRDRRCYTMEVYFIRHGKTEWNTRGVFQGRTDIALSDIGREQARKAGEQIRTEGITFDKVISSPLTRARETATLVSGFSDEQLAIDDRLVEMAFGVMEGTDFYTPSYPGCEKAARSFGGLFEDPVHFEAPEGCETFQELQMRTGAFLEDLRKWSAETNAPGRVLVVSHGGVIRSLLLSLRGMPLKELWSIKVPNCRLFHFTFSEGRTEERPDPFGVASNEAWT